MPPKQRHHKPINPETTEPAMIRHCSHKPAFALLALILLLTGGCATVNLDKRKSSRLRSKLRKTESRL